MAAYLMSLKEIERRIPPLPQQDTQVRYLCVQTSLFMGCSNYSDKPLHGLFQLFKLWASMKVPCRLISLLMSSPESHHGIRGHQNYVRRSHPCRYLDEELNVGAYDSTNMVVQELLSGGLLIYESFIIVGEVSTGSPRSILNFFVGDNLESHQWHLNGCFTLL